MKVHAMGPGRMAGIVLLLLVAGCVDRGAQGSAPFRLNDEDGGAATFTWAYYTSIIAEGDSVAVAWMNQNGPRHRDVMVRHSADGGRTWSEPLLLNDGEYANTISVVPRLTRLPGAGELLAVWQARRNEQGQKYVLTRRSTDFGRTFSAVTRLNSVPQAFLPAVAVADDGTVLVAFDDERNIDRDVFVNRSLDAGQQWLEKDVRVDTLPRSESGAPAVALGRDGYAYVVFEERPRRMRGREELSPHLLAASSADRGQTWSEPVRVVPHGEKASPLWPALVEAGGRLILVWSGGISGDGSQSWLWLATSTDHGATWSPPATVYEGQTQPLYQILAHGSQVYLTWHGGEADQPGGIYFNASDDGGQTWRRTWSDPLRVDRPGEDKAVAFHPRLAVHDDKEVAVTWQEGQVRVLLSLSRDGGRNWPTTPLVVATSAGSEQRTVRYPQVAVTGDAAYVVWEEWTERSRSEKTRLDLNKQLPRDVFVRRVDLP